MENSEDRKHGGMKESLLEQFTIVRQETNLSHVMKYGDLSFLNWKIGIFQGNLSEPSNQQEKGSHLRPAHPATVERRQLESVDAVFSELMPKTSVSARLATLHSLQHRTLKAEAGLYGDKSEALATKLRAELTSELTLAAIYDRAYTHITRTLLGVESVEEALARPLFPSQPDQAISQWACYKAANVAVARTCGHTTDYAMRYLRENARACEILDGRSATVVSVIADACSKAKQETEIKGPASIASLLTAGI